MHVVRRGPTFRPMKSITLSILVGLIVLVAVPAASQRRVGGPMALFQRKPPAR